MMGLFDMLGFGRIREKKVVREFVKFGVVGGMGTLINIAVLYLLTEKFGLYYMVSAVFSFMIAISHNFVLNKAWTFKENVKEEIGKKYFQFVFANVLVLIVNLSLLYFFTEFFGLYYIFSQLLATFITLFLNFFINKAWTFSSN